MEQERKKTKKCRIDFNCQSQEWKDDTMALLRWFSGSSAKAGFIKLIQILKMEKCKLTDFEKRMQDGIGKEIFKDKGGRL